MKAKTLEEVVVYQKAKEGADAVFAILQRPGLREDFELKDQLSRSSARVPPLIAEGYGQTTDRHLASYLGRARGSAFETRDHLTTARNRRYLEQDDCAALVARYEAIGRMLTSWIHYLQKTNWKDRR